MATEYEQIKNAGIDPQVSELAEYHGLGWTAARACGSALKSQNSDRICP